jgi:hypothetical protein
MAFASHRFAYAFEAQGELGFTYWTYATSDELREVLTADYFGSMCRSMRVGDVILVGTRPQPSVSPWRSSNGETRRVLLMVNDVDPGGIVRVRVVQDYGRPEDPDAELALPPRKRGRPPKAAGAGQSTVALGHS